MRHRCRNGILRLDHRLSLAQGSKFQVPSIRMQKGRINSILPQGQWQYVNTSENPADLLTRGVTVQSLVNNSLWINGPAELSNAIATLQSTSIVLPEDVPETREVCNISIADSQLEESFLTRYSELDRLVRIAYLVWQFLSRTNLRLAPKYGCLNSRTRGLYLICHISQCVFFRPEMLALANSESLHRQSLMQSLSMFLDLNGLLRVGGRLCNSMLSYASKHPIIISRRSKLTELLARYYHECPILDFKFHADRLATLGRLQSRYWIHGGAHRLVKAIVNNCV